MSRLISIKYSTPWNPHESEVYKLDTTSINLHHLTINQIDISGLKYLKQLERINLQSNNLETIDLSPLSSCRKLTHLYLGNNRLEHIDMTPLSECVNLSVISIHDNELVNIDLSPLSKCKNITYLNLSENNISEINLLPLVNAQRLRRVNLHSNGLHHINLAPLLLCRVLERVDVERNATALLEIVSPVGRRAMSSILIGIFLLKTVKHGMPQWLQELNRHRHIDINHYGMLIKKLGWIEASRKIISLLGRRSKRDWLKNQQELMRIFGMDELACYDGDLIDILLLIPNSCRFDKGVNILYNRILKLLQEQLDSGASTILFDIEKLARTPGCVLIPSILEKRRQEIEEMILHIKNDRVNLLPLWRTGYGNQILKTLRCGTDIDMRGFKVIENQFEEIGIPIKSKQVPKHVTEQYSTIVSQEMMEVVLSSVLQKR